MQAAGQDNRTGRAGKNPSMIRAESHEMLLIIALKMRKLPAIKSLGHR